MNTLDPAFETRVLELREEIYDSIEKVVKSNLIEATPTNVTRCMELIFERVEKMQEQNFTQVLNQVSIAIMTINNEID